jgi:4a-hydroxytetrahydrobiopterin dehydratase
MDSLTSQPLAARHCVPCEAGTPPLARNEAEALLPLISSRWRLGEALLQREIVFRTFPRAMAFLNELANIAESEGHHPDFCCSYNRVSLELTTHAIKGLSENDFILAAKIDDLLRRLRD